MSWPECAGPTNGFVWQNCRISLPLFPWMLSVCVIGANLNGWRRVCQFRNKEIFHIAHMLRKSEFPCRLTVPGGFLHNLRNRGAPEHARTCSCRAHHPLFIGAPIGLGGHPVLLERASEQ